jgi:hypothetical protein
VKSRYFDVRTISNARRLSADCASSSRSIVLRSWYVSGILADMSLQSPGNSVDLDSARRSTSVHAVELGQRVHNQGTDGYTRFRERAMLVSNELSQSEDLRTIAAGERQIEPGEKSESVGIVQCALVAAGFALPEQGCDDIFGQEAQETLVRFKFDRELSSRSPVVDVETIERLDLECAFMEGAAVEPEFTDVPMAFTDPFAAGVRELQGDTVTLQRWLDVFDLDARICLRTSFVLAQEFSPGVESIAAMVGRFVEPFIVRDYTTQHGVSALDFFDLKQALPTYADFLIRNNPSIAEATLRDLAAKKRPDILRHRDPLEWYEIKPWTFSGAMKGRLKRSEILRNFDAAGVPYRPGRTYTPTKEIRTFTFDTDAGETFDMIIRAFRSSPGLILYTLCFRGDAVRYFNRVRTVAGLLGLLAAAGIIALPAEKAAALVAELSAIAQFFRVTLPALIARP